MRTIEYKGKKYEIDSYYCNKCKADASIPMCIDHCRDKMKRLPVNIKWICPNCSKENINKDLECEYEYVQCECGIEYAVDVENGKVVDINEKK